MRSDQCLQLVSSRRQYLYYWLLSFRYRLVPIHGIHGSVDPWWLLVCSDRVVWLSLCENQHGMGKDINGTFVPLPTCWPRFCKPTCYVTTSCFFSQLVHLSVFFVFVFALFGLIAPAQMIKRLWIRGFLPACNWGNHVFVLVRTTGASRQPLPRASRMVDPGQNYISPFGTAKSVKS